MTQHIDWWHFVKWGDFQTKKGNQTESNSNSGSVMHLFDSWLLYKEAEFYQIIDA